jgi:hypothetical protein
MADAASLFRAIGRWLLQHWRALRRSPGPQGEVAAVPVRARRQRAKPDDANEAGEFYFREAILDQLDEYFAVLPRMKKADPDGYALFSRIGAVVLPKDTLFDLNGLSPIWTGAMPSAGAITYCGAGHGKTHDSDKGKHVAPRVVSFTKYDGRAFHRLYEPARRGEAVYQLAAYFDLDDDDRTRGALGFLIGVDKQGAIRPLRCLVVGQRLPDGTQIPVRKWKIDPTLADWARDADETPQQLAQWLFVHAARAWERATEWSMTRVTVRKGDLVATFAVNIQRTPYFFKDRDQDGGNRRRKIFHIVRAHERELAGGRTSSVKMHFRGERRFRWNGYDVLVTVPGFHHRSLITLNIGGHDHDENAPVPTDMVTMDEFAEAIAGAMDA